jgi:hypothetical protein
VDSSWKESSGLAWKYLSMWMGVRDVLGMVWGWGECGIRTEFFVGF